VVEFFAGRTKREREDLLRVFAGLAASPYQRGEWQQRTTSGRELQVKRFGRWLVRYWLDDPVLELRIVDDRSAPTARPQTSLGQRPRQQL
jgi:hypothetical protein